MRNRGGYRRATWPAFALLAMVALALPGCAALQPGGAASETIAKVEAASKPRQRVDTLARVLKQTQEGLGQAFIQAQLSAEAMAGTEAPQGRAKKALKEAGDLLDTAGNDRALADTAVDKAAKAKYLGQAVANEILAQQRCDAAEADINPLRELLNRARGVPAAVPVPLPPASG